jgi:DNA-binding MarR family transcriptional regulator
MEFFDALVRYEITLWRAVDLELGRQGQVSLGQLHALRVVARYDGGARVQDLSEDIAITAGAASKLADRLERDGLAVRSPNPANRRSSLIALTPAGSQALASAAKVFSAAVAEATGQEDLELLAAALRRLQGRLDNAGTGQAA